jgi:uncharacterized protein (TIRG00374 family)
MSALPHQADLTSFPIGELGAFLLVIWISFLVAVRYPNHVLQSVQFLTRKTALRRFRKQITNSTAQFLNGLSVLRRPISCGVALAESVGIWLLNAITYWAGLMALDIMTPGKLGALFTQSVSALAIALPLSPGHFGAFEAGIRFSLSLFSVSPSQVLAYAIIMRFVMYIMTGVIAVSISASLGLLHAKKGILSGIKDAPNKA